MSDPSSTHTAHPADLQREVELLRAELEETNQGVVALYAELDNQAEQLRQASDLKSRFLSYMSHEFRTPLSSIRSMAKLLEDEYDGPLTDEQRKQVNFLNAAAKELSEMVDDLLDLAKIEAGRITVSPAWFEMVDLFAALRGMFRPIVDETDASLYFDEPAGIPKLYTDDKKVAQILRNFISNALKFTPKGEVRVSACLESSGMVRFAVKDSGIGIPEDVQPQLFQEFSQIDSTLQKRYRGTGLGLSLCKRFAELLGGYVGLESEVGKGALFYVVLPIHHQSERQGEFNESA
jgi:signal transduction histidine kinase